MKFKNILFFSFFIFTASVLYSQNNSDSSSDLSGLKFFDRLQFSVGGGVMFGNTYSNINLQPQIGYKITNRWIAGLGSNLQYYKNTVLGIDPIVVYGGNAFTRYFLNDNIFAQAEYQKLNFSSAWGDYAMLGGGYLPAHGVYISAYYLLLYPESANVYGAPYVIRLGFNF